MLLRCVRNRRKFSWVIIAKKAAVYAGHSGISRRIGGEEAVHSFRHTSRAADRLLRVILCLRGGDLFKGKSKLASCARKQRSSSY